MNNPYRRDPDERGAERHFELELRQLEQQLVGLGTSARAALADAVDALVRHDTPSCRRVIASDDDLDRRYLAIEQDALGFVARRAPVAGDLRFVIATLSVGRHLERIGDMAVNIAKLALATDTLPRDDRLHGILDEMGTRALEIIDDALRAFAERDTGVARRFIERDEAVDDLHQQMFSEIFERSDDPRRLEWAVRMHQASRHLERSADHAVDIAEQLAFVVTGELSTFPDDSAAHHLE